MKFCHRYLHYLYYIIIENKKQSNCFIFFIKKYICNILSNLIRKFLETNGFCTKIEKIKF